MKKWCLILLVSVCSSAFVSPVNAKVTSESLGYKVLATSQHEPEQLVAAKYTVRDGDTVDLELSDGKQVKGRLLLVDAPELKRSKADSQTYGEMAKQKLETILGKADKITLEYDSGKKLADNGREWIYLWADGILVQEIMVTEGFSRVNYVYPENSRYLEAIRESEAYAKRNSLNVWSGANVYEDEVIDKTPVVKQAEPAADQNVYYKNCTEVRAAGAAPIRPGDPGWDPKFDRDHDGIGCE